NYDVQQILQSFPTRRSSDLKKTIKYSDISKRNIPPFFAKKIGYTCLNTINFINKQPAAQMLQAFFFPSLLSRQKATLKFFRHSPVLINRAFNLLRIKISDNYEIHNLDQGKRHKYHRRLFHKDVVKHMSQGGQSNRAVNECNNNRCKEQYRCLAVDHFFQLFLCQTHFSNRLKFLFVIIK